ncbi:MAG: hypothetical protein ABFS32_05770 [Bacteroidota bacterium]
MQETLVAVTLIGAILYISWYFYQRSQKKSDCGPGCGCDSVKPTISESKKK